MAENREPAVEAGSKQWGRARGRGRLFSVSVLLY